MTVSPKVSASRCRSPFARSGAALFTGAKIAHLANLPQGQPERYDRALKMLAQVREEAFGYCTNIGECEAACPKEIKLEVIAQMNRDFLKGSVIQRPELAVSAGA